jgi:hypothetical protein
MSLFGDTAKIRLSGFGYRMIGFLVELSSPGLEISNPEIFEQPKNEQAEISLEVDLLSRGPFPRSRRACDEEGGSHDCLWQKLVPERSVRHCRGRSGRRRLLCAKGMGASGG